MGLRRPQLSRMGCLGGTDLIIVVESVGVDDISQREQGKNQGLNPGIDQCFRGWWEKAQRGGWPKKYRSQESRGTGAKRVEFQGVKSSDIRHREVKQDKDREVPIVLGN